VCIIGYWYFGVDYVVEGVVVFWVGVVFGDGD